MDGVLVARDHGQGGDHRLKRVRPVAYGFFSEVLQLPLVEVLCHVLDGLVAVTVTRQAEQHPRRLAEQRVRRECAASQQVPERFPALRQREPVQGEDSLLMDQQQFVPLLNLGVTGLGNAHTGHRLVGVVHHAMRPAVLTGDQVLLLDEPVVEDLLDRIGLIDDQQVHVVLDLLQPAHVGFRRIGFGAHERLRRRHPHLRAGDLAERLLRRADRQQRAVARPGLLRPDLPEPTSAREILHRQRLPVRPHDLTVRLKKA